MDYRSPTLEKATRSRIEHLDRTWHERQAGEGGGEGGVLQAVGAGAMEIKGEEIEKGRWKKDEGTGGGPSGREGKNKPRPIVLKCLALN